MKLKATLTKRDGDRIVITVRNDKSGDPVRVTVLSPDDAIKLRHWFIGMADMKGPVEFRVGKVEYFFFYEVWQPMLECLNTWFEENYAD